jgi:hypothetical protein
MVVDDLNFLILARILCSGIYSSITDEMNRLCSGIYSSEKILTSFVCA